MGAGLPASLDCLWFAAAYWWRTWPARADYFPRRALDQKLPNYKFDETSKRTQKTGRLYPDSAFGRARPGLQEYSPPAPPALPADRAPIVEDQSQVDAKRLNDGASKLIDAMKRPTRSFQFTSDGEVNLEADPVKPPDVGKERS